MKPWFEAVQIPPGQSCLIYERRLPTFSFNWHYHPEYELTLTLNSRGRRFVGGMVSAYDDADLVLLGPNLPHAWKSDSVIDPIDSHRAVVCWFTQGWLDGVTQAMPELGSLQVLATEAEGGVLFPQETGLAVASRLTAICTLSQAAQIVELQSLLLTLSTIPGRQRMDAQGSITHSVSQDRVRMKRVLDWLDLHFDQPIRLAHLCALAHVTESQLQRIFKRSTRTTISDYVTRRRVARACHLLVNTDAPMTAIAADCGFSDGAHFSRKFAEMTGRPPSRYRKAIRETGPAQPEGYFPMQRRN